MSPENENVKPGDDEQEEEFVAVEDEPGKEDQRVGEDEDEGEGEGEGEEGEQQDERLAGDQETDDDKKERRRSENKLFHQ